MHGWVLNCRITVARAGLTENKDLSKDLQERETVSPEAVVEEDYSKTRQEDKS